MMISILISLETEKDVYVPRTAYLLGVIYSTLWNRQKRKLDIP